MSGLRIFGIGFAATLAIALTGCGNGAPTGSSLSGAPANGTAGATVAGTVAGNVSATDSLSFSPTAASVKVGDVVKFTNTGSVPHNVTFDAPNDSLSSSTLQQNDTWEVSFKTPGTYSFHCTFHPGMQGKVTVS